MTHKRKEREEGQTHHLLQAVANLEQLAHDGVLLCVGPRGTQREVKEDVDAVAVQQGCLGFDVLPKLQCVAGTFRGTCLLFLAVALASPCCGENGVPAESGAHWIHHLFNEAVIYLYALRKQES